MAVLVGLCHPFRMPSRAVTQNSAESINELDLGIGTRGGEPHLSLQLCSAARQAVRMPGLDNLSARWTLTHRQHSATSPKFSAGSRLSCAGPAPRSVPHCGRG